MMGIRAVVTAALALAISWLATPATASTLVSAHFASAALGREWTYNVYLPDGYDSGRQRYPVFYLLHGNGADQNE